MEVDRPDTLDLMQSAIERADEFRFQRVTGGHQLALKHIIEADGQKFFVKSFAPHLFTDDEKRQHSLDYLKKEYRVMRHLADSGYDHIPSLVEWVEDKQALILDAYPPDEGWHWELPEGHYQRSSYIGDVFTALGALPTIGQSFETTSDHDSMQEYYDLGWGSLEDDDTREAALARLQRFDEEGAFHDHVRPGLLRLYVNLLNDEERERQRDIAQQHLLVPRPVIGHYDARQSNIAWHPEEGAHIVDWSWAAPAPINSDETMFIIDLFKSGQDVSSLMHDHFDRNHAAMLIGFWLGRGGAPTPTEDETVRFHQLASAASAITLLHK